MGVMEVCTAISQAVSGVCDIFRCDSDTNEPFIKRSAADARECYLSIRKIHIMADDTLVFYDRFAAQTVMISPSGAQTELVFDVERIGVLPEGLLAYYDHNAEHIFVADLAESAETAALDVVIEENDQFYAPSSLSLLPDGDLLNAGLHNLEGGSYVYVVDMP